MPCDSHVDPFHDDFNDLQISDLPAVDFDPKDFETCGPKGVNKRPTSINKCIKQTMLLKVDLRVGVGIHFAPKMVPQMIQVGTNIDTKTDINFKKRISTTHDKN